MRDERGEWPSEELPKSWRWVPFEQFFNDVTDSSRKLQQKAEPQGYFLSLIEKNSSAVTPMTEHLCTYKNRH